MSRHLSTARHMDNILKQDVRRAVDERLGQAALLAGNTSVNYT
jgi:hypothetical protein